MTGTAPFRTAGLFVHLVRHGAAEGASGRCAGHADLPLSAYGREQVVRLGAAWPAPRPSVLVASDLARARDTATLLAAAWGDVELTTDPRLREMHFGEWDGESWEEVHRTQPAALARWADGWSSGSRVPGGEGFHDVIRRVASWLDGARREARVPRAEDDTASEVVAVAHAGSIRALIVHALGLPRDVAFRLRLDHARVTGLWIPEHESAGGAELVYLNSDLPVRSWTGRGAPGE